MDDQDPLARDDSQPGQRSGVGSASILRHLRNRPAAPDFAGATPAALGVQMQVVGPQPGSRPPVAGDGHDAEGAQALDRAVGECEGVLDALGLHAALAWLNARTQHRFTGVWRYDGDMLHSVCLFDRTDPSTTIGASAPVARTYCGILFEMKSVVLVIENTHSDTRFPTIKDSAVVSYCGAMLKDGRGHPWGTLCHWDPAPQPAAEAELALLPAIAPAVLRAARLLVGERMRP